MSQDFGRIKYQYFLIVIPLVPACVRRPLLNTPRVHIFQRVIDTLFRLPGYPTGHVGSYVVVSFHCAVRCVYHI